jgi:hypothetical protein
MKSPPKRKKTRKQCPINVNSLYRRWERGDRRIDWPRIETLLDRWERGEKVPWRKLSHTFIKAGPCPTPWHPEGLRPLRPQRQRRRLAALAEETRRQLNVIPDPEFLERLRNLIQEDTEAADVLARTNP